MESLLGIKDRVALIVGATSGYGLQSAIKLSEHGVKIVASSRDKLSLNKMSERLHTEFSLIAADISRIDECERLVQEAYDQFGRLDIVVHTAAFLESRESNEVDGEHWQKTLDTNLRSQFFIARSAIEIMKKQKWGRIINFTSTAGLSGGLPASIVYGISKSGALSMIKNMARENARYGVLINAISPASLDSPLFRRGLPDREIEALKAKLLEVNLFGRWIQAEEVCNAVLFLASEMSSTITGHVLRADGGAELSGL